MKIHALTQAGRYLGIVQSRKDGEGGGHGPHDQNQQQNPGREENEADGANYQEVEEKVHAALNQFKSDGQTQASGLSASASGSGPGLKVTLKDSSGAVLRQVSGEEFLRLRQSLSKEGHVRGKLLDQKF